MDLDYFVAPERYTTEAFVIRCYFPGDEALLSEAINSSYDHLKTFMPWAKPDQSVEETRRVVHQWRARYLLNENYGLGIFEPDEGRFLGSTGFHLREGSGLSNLSAEIGMWIRGDAAGQGLGTRVLQALVAWGFSAWPWQRLAWRCDADNMASRRTAEKAGFTLEGVLRAYRRLESGVRKDTYCYGLLKDEWKTAHER